MPRSQFAVALAMLLVAFLPAACHRAPQRTGEGELPSLVSAEQAQIGNIRGFVSGTGVVVTPGDADFLAVAAESGRILEILKKVGDPVKGGEILVRLEFPSVRLESAARSAAGRTIAARLQSAKLTQARVHELFERGAASRKEVEDADREFELAEAEAAAAREAEALAATAAQRSVIQAPFDGIVADRLHNPGDTVAASPADPILRVVDPNRVEVAAFVALKDVSRFAIGASARVVSGGIVQPEMMHVSSVPVPESGATTLPVHLTFDQPTKLSAGTQVGVEIDAEQHSNVLLVPAIAVVAEQDKTQVVFVAAGDRAIRRVVTTGLADAEHVEIHSGLKAGDLVITQGQTNLKDGSAVSASVQDRMKD
jgi:RND family efflux transporter MFP subunit